MSNPAIREQIKREQRQFKIWSAGFMAKIHRSGSMTLAYRDNPNHIAVITPEGDKWRFTWYRPDGPSGHEILTDFEMLRSVYFSWVIDPDAPARLDSWVGTEIWNRGMKVIEYLELWNGFSAVGNYDACHKMDEARRQNLEAGIDKGRELSIPE